MILADVLWIMNPVPSLFHHICILTHRRSLEVSTVSLSANSQCENSFKV